VVTKYQELKLKHQYRYLFFKLSDDLKEVIFESATEVGADASSEYTNFVSSLPAKECRYAVYDFAFKAEDGGDRNKILFVLWYVL
jgi:cofilin